MTPLAKALGSAYLRVGGTRADVYTFVPSNSTNTTNSPMIRGKTQLFYPPVHKRTIRPFDEDIFIKKVGKFCQKQTIGVRKCTKEHVSPFTRILVV